MRAASEPDRHDIPRPAFTQPQFLAVVFLGGVIGSAARFLLAEAIPTEAGQWPWATFAVNLAGAFLLALLLVGLVRRGGDHGMRRWVRLGVGTGVLGSFTTYSAFAVEVNDLLSATTGLGLLYGGVTVVAGLAAGAAGVLLAKVLIPVGGEKR